MLYVAGSNFAREGTNVRREGTKFERQTNMPNFARGGATSTANCLREEGTRIAQRK